MAEHYFYFISSIGAVQGILLGIVFFLKKFNHAASKFLGAYILIYSIGLFEPYLDKHLPAGVFTEIVMSLFSISNFLYGPFLYLFILKITTKESPRYYLHFIPFIAGFIIYTSVVLLFSEEIYFLLKLILFELLIIQILTYNIIAIRRLVEYRHHILQVYSNLFPKDLLWLQGLLIIITATYIISFSITHCILFGFEQAGTLYIIVQLMITITIYWMSYKVILSPQLFMLIPATETSNGKYQRSGLKTEKAAEYLEMLKQYMEKEKPYKNPEITIYDISEKLGISKNHLTQVLNEQLQKNFYEFINMYRVEEVKKMMGQPEYDHLTLSGIGMEAGFNSKAAFNTNFKKVTGSTPSEWKKKYFS